MDIAVAGLSFEYSMTISLVWERKRGCEQLVFSGDFFMAEVLPWVAGIPASPGTICALVAAGRLSSSELFVAL